MSTNDIIKRLEKMAWNLEPDLEEVARITAALQNSQPAPNTFAENQDTAVSLGISAVERAFPVIMDFIAISKYKGAINAL